MDHPSTLAVRLLNRSPQFPHSGKDAAESLGSAALLFLGASSECLYQLFDAPKRGEEG